jgi:high-affinity Fe2+/Pb2+ permease
VSNLKSELRRSVGISWLTLFTSSGTLVCCALPIILVSLGMGATIAALTSAFPFLIFLSLHKIWIFALSGIMLALSLWFIYRPGQYCPADPEQARICAISKTWNKRIVWFSLAIWCAGFFAAFIALPLRMALGI